MFVEAADIPEGNAVQADVCVVGAGPAGITLARWLATKSLDVCLLESGGLEIEDAVQRLNEGQSEGTWLPVGSGYERLSRLRVFGGASGHWGGIFRPLDPIDFEPRSWVPNSGWPMAFADIASYYGMACAICGIQGFDDAAELPRIVPRPPFPESPQWLSQVFHQNRIHFGTHYRNEIRSSPRIRVILHATAIDVAAAANGEAVERVQAAAVTGKRFTVRARAYVLAAGGLENARLLLVSNSVQRKGLGNDRDQVGRYFMEHPHAPIGRVILWRSLQDLTSYMDVQTSASAGRRIAVALRLSDEVMRARRLLNCTFTFVPLYTPFDPSRPAHETFLRSEVREMHPELTPPLPSTPGFEGWYDSYAKQTALFESVDALASDLNATRSSASITNGGPGFRGILYARSEQSPNPDSRVALDDRRDPFGRSRLRLHWQLAETDISSMIESAKFIGRELGRLGLGRAQAMIEWPTWPVVGGGFHHMGTTRMHVSPAQGVTDGIGRVHGVSNLYISGSSLFPTSGHANPTLTLVALALRLADHLTRTL
jgi:choline dehydrogenase-like flavoprotein